MKSDAHVVELLQKGLAALEIPDDAEQLQKYLLRYIHELELFNAAFNLIKAENTDELVIKHIFDSLAPWKIIAEKIDSHTDSRPCTVADIGSGAGFPGIPLACLFLLRNPDVEFTLIERMNKRCAVLENVRAVLGLSNTSILEVEAEKAPADYFDIAVFRAFRPLDHTILRTVQGRVRADGLLAAYKGKRCVIEEEMNALGSDMPAYSVIPVHVPFCDSERNLVIIGKSLSSAG